MCQLISEEHYGECDHVVQCHLKYQLQYCPAPNGIPFHNPDNESLSFRVPGRHCPEEAWQTGRLKKTGFCPTCVEKKEKRANQIASLNIGSTPHQAQGAGHVKVYSCAHQRFMTAGGKVFQHCFSPDTARQSGSIGYRTGMSSIFRRTQAERQEPGNSTRFGSVAAALMGRRKPAVAAPMELLDQGDQNISDFDCSGRNCRFSWRKHRELRFRFRTSHDKCPECLRGETKQAMRRGGGGAGGRMGSRKPPGLRILT